MISKRRLLLLGALCLLFVVMLRITEEDSYPLENDHDFSLSMEAPREDGEEDSSSSFSSSSSSSSSSSFETETLIVQAAGSPPGNGSSSSSSSGRVFRSIEEAVKQARENKKTSALRQRILIKEGEYRLTSSLVLGHEDAELLVEGESQKGVVITGGISVPVAAFSALSGSDLPELPAQVRKEILKADLSSLLRGGEGADEEGEPYGFGFPVLPSRPEVFIDGQPLRLARYPNTGYLQTGKVIRPGGLLPDENFTQGAAFEVQGAPSRKFAEWKTQKNLWAFGYWKFDWADQGSPVRVSGEKLLELTDPTYYGVTNGSRFFVYNSPADLDYPGEYLIRGQVLFLYPPKPLTEGTSVVLSLMKEPLLVFKETASIRVQRLTLEATRGTAVQVIGGHGLTLKALTIRNVGNAGVIFGVGSDNQVVGRIGGSALDESFRNTTWQRHCGIAHMVDLCHIYNIGYMGVIVGGGDRLSLTPGFNVVRRSNIHHFSRLSTTYRPGVWLDGVGNVVQRNSIHHAPHSGILFWGNEHTIERNVFHHLVSDTSDAGLIYTGRDFTARGTRIQANLFYHSQSVNPGRGAGAQGVYLDDFASGIVVRDNFFYNVSRAFALGGGQENTFVNNIILNCTLALLADARGLVPKYYKHFSPTGDVTLRYERVPVNSPEWKKQYPQLAWAWEFERHLPHNNTIQTNLLLFSRATFTKSLKITREVELLGAVGKNLVYGEGNSRDKKIRNRLLFEVEMAIRSKTQSSSLLVALRKVLQPLVSPLLPEFDFDHL